MERVVVADRPSVDDHCLGVRPLTEALGATDVALNHFELGPDESPALGVHAHLDQEEVFYVLSGAVAVEFAGTDPGGETVRVAAGEVSRFAPGEYQRVWNREAEPAAILAIGAPPATESADVRNDCPACDDRTRTEVTTTATELVCRCGDCGTVLRRVERSG